MLLYSIMHQNDSNESLAARLKYLNSEIQILREEEQAIKCMLDQRGNEELQKLINQYENTI